MGGGEWGGEEGKKRNERGEGRRQDKSLVGWWSCVGGGREDICLSNQVDLKSLSLAARPAQSSLTLPWLASLFTAVRNPPKEWKFALIRPIKGNTGGGDDMASGLGHGGGEEGGWGEGGGGAGATPPHNRRAGRTHPQI